jgi:hypothetical protein
MKLQPLAFDERSACWIENDDRWPTNRLRYSADVFIDERHDGLPQVSGWRAMLGTDIDDEVAQPSEEIGHNEDERDNDGDEETQPDGDTREGDERRSLDFAGLELLAQPVGLLTRVCGETLRLLAQLAVQVEVGVAAAKSALNGLVAPLRLISHLAPLVLIGHVPSLAEEPLGPEPGQGAPGCGVVTVAAQTVPTSRSPACHW